MFQKIIDTPKLRNNRHSARMLISLIPLIPNQDGLNINISFLFLNPFFETRPKLAHFFLTLFHNPP